jgi:hypothetical protein
MPTLWKYFDLPREAPVYPPTTSAEFAKPFRVSVKIAKAVLCYGCAAWLACVG